MAGIQQAILEMAMERFGKELKNPNSELSKKFTGALFGDKTNGTRGIFDELTDMDAMKGMLTGQDQNASQEQAPDKIRTAEEIAAAMDRYKRTPLEAFVDNALPTVGKVAKGVGTGVNAYHSLLGDALLAVQKGLQTPGYADPFALAPLAAAGLKAKGAIAQVAGDTTDSITHSVSNDLKYNREKDKETEILLSERPSGQFYDARKQLSKGQFGSKDVR